MQPEIANMPARAVALALLCLLWVGCQETNPDPVPGDDASDTTTTAPETTDSVDATEEINPLMETQPGTLIPAPVHGYQIVVGPFTVAPGEEKTLCAYANVPIDTDTDLIRIQTAMTAGSHHMNLFLSFVEIEKEGTHPCGSENMTSLIIFGAQEERHDVILPDGLALPVAAQHQLIIEAHYINTHPTDEIEALGVANLFLGPVGTADEYAGIMAFFPDEILVPPGEQGVSTTRCIVAFDAEIFFTMSHMHQFGSLFEAFLIDGDKPEAPGTRIYDSDDWHAPAFNLYQYGEMIPVKAGDIIEYTCHYNNWMDIPLTRGGSAETNEMCMFGAAYIPYHGILLCQPPEAQQSCPAIPEPDPDAAGVCPNYWECMNECGGLNVHCSNCCSPTMTPPCMNCLSGVLGCALSSGCGSGLNFEFPCLMEHCGEELTKCSSTEDLDRR